MVHLEQDEFVLVGSMKRVMDLYQVSCLRLLSLINIDTFGRAGHLWHTKYTMFDYAWDSMNDIPIGGCMITSAK